MTQRYFLKFPIALALLAASTSLTATAAASDEVREAQFGALDSADGVWRVTRQGIDCTTGVVFGTFPALMTFHMGGTVSGQGFPPGSNAYGPAEHGVWHRAGGHTFQFRLLSYSYDDNGLIAGSTEVAGTGKLTGTNTLAYKSTLRFFDANGDLLFSGCGRATAFRF